MHIGIYFWREFEVYITTGTHTNWNKIDYFIKN